MVPRLAATFSSLSNSNALGFSERMGGVRAVKPAPVCPQHFDRYDCPHRTDNDRLWLRVALRDGTDRSRFQGGDLILASVGHRHALLNKQHTGNQRRRRQHIDHDPPHIEKEIPNLRFTTEGPDYCGQSTESDRRREEHV